ncbi:MAG: hypothetical protein AB1716_11935 [Planctomycetota bacterium]
MRNARFGVPVTRWRQAALVLALVLAGQITAGALAFEIRLQDQSGAPVNGFRWLVEADNTNQPEPGVGTATCLAVDIHASHAPVLANGHSATNTAVVNLPGTQRYVVSVLPDAAHTLGGANVAIGQATVTITVNRYPVPTAQISILAFEDTTPINNIPELPTERGLQGFTVMISDALGQVSMDALGNPLGTTYMPDPNNPGQWVPQHMGNSVITTNEFGEALVRFLPPGKYGIRLIPPTGENWIQTSTIEGTPTIDAWVKAGEPRVFVEFGPASYHVFVGFVQAFDDLSGGGQTGSITGRLVYNHFSRPPFLQGYFSGPPVEDGWIGLNEAFARIGLYAGPCGPDGDFSISGIPEGTYQLVTWDRNLDSIFGFRSVTIPDRTDPNNVVWDLNLGDVLAFAWFGNLEGKVFYDVDQDGFPDQDEVGIPEQALNLRFRDGTIYQGTVTDMDGSYNFPEVFPFFKWLVTEVDFLRYRDTGFTNVVDYGGEIPPDAGWAMPSRGKLNPQPQAAVNPNTGNNLSRTEVSDGPGATLLQAMQLYLTQTNVIDWGKCDYDGEASGGISGIVQYAVTRAENDPRYATADPWEPGVPRAQVVLYEDMDENGQIDDLNGNNGGGPGDRADRDNYPLGWADGSAPKGPEDVDWNGNGVFDPGDAIQITWTDSWDDNRPSGCIQNLPIIHGQTVQECFDNFATWNQLRPGVFDGGFAMTSHYPGGMASNPVEQPDIPPGTYIVEAAPPPGYETQREEDKNVDFGDEFYPYTDALPPACVGDLHQVPPYLLLFPGVEAPYAGQDRPLCDRRQVYHSGNQNTAVNFFIFTEVPKAARAVGFINNDLAAEFDPTSPVYGEKSAPSWVPISFQDYAGHEITRVYSDEFGCYNALLPSSFTVNAPTPTGVSPHMISFVINHPGPIPDPLNPTRMVIDPYFDTSYSQTPYTFQFESSRTTYLDTPVIPVAAFAGFPTRQFDANPPTGTPIIYAVNGPGTGPVIWGSGLQVLTIDSLGLVTGAPAGGFGDAPVYVQQDYGFGNTRGTVRLNGVDLNILSWTRNRIRVRVELTRVQTGPLLVMRGDNQKWTPMGVTVHKLATNSAIRVNGGSIWPQTKIQDAIDAAPAGALIVVGPGTYNENVIIYKNVKLQGTGAGSTFINGSPIPSERAIAWHTKINALIASGELVPIDPGMFEAIEGPCVFVHGKPETFGANNPGLIDGFTLMGAVAGGGAYLAGYADYVQLSNNRITNNQGTFGGGVTIGVSDNNGFNNNVTVTRNLIMKNGGVDGSGGIVIFRGSDDYALTDNWIVGNFSRFSGGGVGHIGLSDGGLLYHNTIAFNEVFYGALLGGDGGGVYISGDPGAVNQLGPGTGTVTLDANLIQGNLAGSGSGGGVRVQMANGQETQGPPENWYRINIFNNVIANNVAALRGAGVSLFDAARVNMLHNTIVNNDATATASLAFPAGNLTISSPQPAGLAAEPHSDALQQATNQTFSNPLLVNNIVWHNRSYYWDGTQNNNAGALVPRNPLYWDLQVIGQGALDPQYCLLTSTAGYAGTNITGQPRFFREYFNGLLAAAVLDEAGNNITVRYRELKTTDGNYHIRNTSAAYNRALDGQAALFPELAHDFDVAARPQAGQGDIGCDEYGAGSPGDGDADAAETETGTETVSGPTAGPAGAIE